MAHGLQSDSHRIRARGFCLVAKIKKLSQKIGILNFGVLKIQNCSNKPVSLYQLLHKNVRSAKSSLYLR